MVMTSVIPHRPMTSGEIYRGARRVLAGNWRLLLGLGLAVSVVSQLLALPLRSTFQHDLRATLVGASFSSGDTVRNVAAAGTANLLVAIVGFVLGLAVTAVTIVVAEASVTGRRVDPFRAAVPKLGRLVLMTLMLCGAAFGGFLAVFALMFAVGELGVLLAVAWLLVCVYFAVLFVFAAQAIVVEDLSVMDSLPRSKALVTGGWWRVFGILVLTEAIFSVASWLLALIFPDWLASTIVGAVSTPVVACVITLLYFDYRIRKEGSRTSRSA